MTIYWFWLIFEVLKRCKLLFWRYNIWMKIRMFKGKHLNPRVKPYPVGNFTEQPFPPPATDCQQCNVFHLALLNPNVNTYPIWVFPIPGAPQNPVIFPTGTPPPNMSSSCSQKVTILPEDCSCTVVEGRRKHFYSLECNLLQVLHLPLVTHLSFALFEWSSGLLLCPLSKIWLENNIIIYYIYIITVLYYFVKWKNTKECCCSWD